MCINAETSIGSFVVGTAINGIVLNSNPKTDYFIIALIYEYILTMQLFDFVAWKDPNCGKMNEVATKGAFIQNMLQPVVVMLLLLYYTEIDNKTSKGIVNLLLVFYIGYIFYKLYFNKKPKTITCLKPTKNCKHLQYDWWYTIDRYPIFIYLIPIISSFLLLLTSTNLAIIIAVYFVLSFMISGKFYACGLPSIFCLFVTGGALLNLILMNLGQNQFTI
jgi:hypothetical protein